MADDFLETVLSDEAPAETVVETPEPPQEPVAPEPVVEEPAPEPVQETPVEAAPEPKREGFVPLAAVLDERDKRKALEARIAQYESQQAKPTVPDPYDDPEGYKRHFEQSMQTAIIQDRVERDWENTVEKHGLETAEAVKAWAAEKAQADPIFMQQLDVAMTTKVRPIDWLVQQHARDALLTDIGDPSKLDDWFAREAEKRGYMQSVTVAATPTTVVATGQPAPKPAPPRSIATDAAPSNAGPTGSWDVFDGILKR